jgi:hypothetical protein
MCGGVKKMYKLQGTASAVPQGGAIKTGFSRWGRLAGAKALMIKGVSIGTTEAVP